MNSSLKNIFCYYAHIPRNLTSLSGGNIWPTLYAYFDNIDYYNYIDTAHILKKYVTGYIFLEYLHYMVNSSTLFVQCCRILCNKKNFKEYLFKHYYIIVAVINP